MAYDETLANRIRRVLVRKRGIQEKSMFGGLSFLSKGRMVCGVLNDDLVVRVDPAEGDELLKKPHVRPMNFTGRPMKGFLYIGPAGCKSDIDLSNWIGRALTFTSSLPEKKPR